MNRTSLEAMENIRPVNGVILIQDCKNVIDRRVEREKLRQEAEAAASSPLIEEKARRHPAYSPVK